MNRVQLQKRVLVKTLGALFVRSISHAMSLRASLIMVHMGSDLAGTVFTELGYSEHLDDSISQLEEWYLEGESPIILISQL